MNKVNAPAPALSADAVIQKAVEHSQHASAQNAQSAYTYTKVNVTEELDSTGKVKDRLIFVGPEHLNT